ncbi:SMI1/KNR4 family protein [Streptomyces silvensis]|uniref:Knr4/Smi1-like domain-containing protein n=1 Tax=Streptomyces silvensis TaxID=1765722 RepID=A0A0W7X5T8_9ACTN|nr:SMI1/KNR4 family protein [Streptomyces silvensis]KUF18066.1 hypothetical protein AT728_20805 [Streptomyces silvensis]
MSADFAPLRELIETSPLITTARARGSGKPEAAVEAAEGVVGPLSQSYRWWLTEYGEGAFNATEIASVAPPTPDTVDVTTELEGERLCFYRESDGCGGSFHFALDQWDGEEHPVVRRDHFTGEEDEEFADSFAGFLTVQVALHSGLGEGPNPTIARLWRSTPGVLLPNGVSVYGPHVIRERNDTYEVREYAPDWVLVGDDSGGRGLFMRHHGRDRTSVYALDLGAVEHDVEANGELLTGDLVGWLAAEAYG